MKKHEARNQPGLFFWADPVELPDPATGRPIHFYAVVSQMKGYPATEAHDDWFAHEKDADDIARQYAEQYPNH